MVIFYLVVTFVISDSLPYLHRIYLKIHSLIQYNSLFIAVVENNNNTACM